MNTDDFDFNLPEELTVQASLEKRDSSKLLAIDHEIHEMVDAHFDHILDELNPGDAPVMSDTYVLPAHLYGEKPDAHGHVESFLLRNTQGGQWEVLAKPAKRLRVGAKVSLGDERLTATMAEELDHDGCIVEFAYDGIFLEVLKNLGKIPLSPYIHERLDDPDRYQTVYAKEDGSATAPTAGLHLTQDLLTKTGAKGVKLIYPTFHVRLRTFRPVSVDNTEEHEMHSEFYTLSEKAAQALRDMKAAGRRVVAVGITPIRTLETIGLRFSSNIKVDSDWTNIFIKSGYGSKVAGTFSTNFYLPKSTLVMLMSALVGHEFVLDAYQYVINERYRFFSFGDAILVKRSKKERKFSALLILPYWYKRLGRHRHL